MGDELVLTHEFLAIMLGVRRPGVTEVLQALQERGIIRYRRGKLTVLNRKGLERLSCECYQTVLDGSERLLEEFPARCRTAGVR
jgi:Mn-dependent DtxR family transcriptional regulator